VSVHWTTVKRSGARNVYEPPRHDIASWLATHAGSQGMNGDWYMTSSTKGMATTYLYRFKDKRVAVMFKLIFGGTI
jgi:hypothetical protein